MAKKKKNNNTGLIVGGVVVAGGLLTWYLLDRKKKREAAYALAIQQQQGAAMLPATATATLAPATTSPLDWGAIAGLMGGAATDPARSWAEKQPVVKKGSRGEAVKTLQKWLLVSSDPAGEFGTTTDAAVRQYQNAKYLTPDGIVGANTWTALKKDYESAYVENLLNW